MKYSALKDQLRKQAEYYKDLYIKGQISKDEAIEKIQPYLNVLNHSIDELGRAYKLYIKQQTFDDFMKYRY